MKKKTEEETNKGVKEKIEYEDDGLDYEDLYYDDSSDVDYGLEYTTTQTNERSRFGWKQ